MRVDEDTLALRHELQDEVGAEISANLTRALSRFAWWHATVAQYSASGDGDREAQALWDMLQTVPKVKDAMFSLSHFDELLRGEHPMAIWLFAAICRRTGLSPAMLLPTIDDPETRDLYERALESMDAGVLDKKAHHELLQVLQRTAEIFRTLADKHPDRVDEIATRFHTILARLEPSGLTGSRGDDGSFGARAV